MGYSDITAILNAIHVKTGMITYHGPIAGDNFSSYTYEQFQRLLIEPRQVTRIAEPPAFEQQPGVVERENRLTPIVPGQAEGTLIGGNLSLLVTLLGTPYEPDFDGAILFMEDVSEPPYSVDRMLTHLWLTGHLERTAGIVFGKFTDDGYDSNTLSMEQVLRERCEPLGIPTLRGAMIGHIEDQTVVPIGVRARWMSTTARYLTRTGRQLVHAGICPDRTAEVGYCTGLTVSAPRASTMAGISNRMAGRAKVMTPLQPAAAIRTPALKEPTPCKPKTRKSFTACTLKRSAGL